ncbi:pentapeptide repeat-containing protein [Coleofasciculus sp. FACHB-542]|uniref:pentapeptide repeat-containing protein n=1 Tax=Coleofasciculus sp. FACHB-542 TaxID=2692787 RepID=UPI00168834E3|nr:pentapeptide repeat-containing protein [Coleofasciculus sp. FACHB-542]
MAQDYRRANLKGKSFKGQDLTGADFSHADIRGANFTGAILKGANFSHAKAGLQRRWAIFLVIISLILSALSGFTSVLTSLFTAYFFAPSTIKQITIIPGVVFLIVLAVFFIVTIRQGQGLSAGAGAVAGAGAAVVAAAVAVAAAAAGAAVVAGAVAAAVAAAVAVAGAAAGAAAGARAAVVAGAVAAAGAVAVAVAAAGAAAAAAAAAVAGLGIYMAWRALAGDGKYAFVYTFAVAFAATGGTNFRGADLTDADFTQATLKSTNFRGAILTRTCWHQAKKLDRARVGDSILAKAAVRDLLVGSNGYKKSYAGANLKGANLTGVNLNEANLREADISEATLKAANLEGANLTKAQSVGTDFTNASLTGACLEAWNIDSTTKLEQVDCRYVYLLEHPNPLTGDRERRPHDPDKIFEPGDFEKLYKKIMNTVQILLRNGINPEAFNIAFQKLMEENREITPDSIQTIEKKGNDVLLTIQVPEGTDKGKVQRDFEEPYLARLEAQKQAALLEAEKRYSKEIKEITMILASNPSNLSNLLSNLTIIASGENTTMTDNKNQGINATGSFVNTGEMNNMTGNTINLGQISGAVSNTVNQLPDSPEPGKPSIKELLTQLQTAIEADTNLSEEDKAEALEQVKALAEAGKNPKEGAMQKGAKTAMKILKGTAASLPSAATLVEACNKLLPAIASLLALA